jgi:hypothetical protein
MQTIVGRDTMNNPFIHKAIKVMKHLTPPVPKLKSFLL